MADEHMVTVNVGGVEIVRIPGDRGSIACNMDVITAIYADVSSRAKDKPVASWEALALVVYLSKHGMVPL